MIDRSYVQSWVVRDGPPGTRTPASCALRFTPRVDADASRAPAPFVVGVPRSGTTLLRLLLDAHPDLAIPAETGFGVVLAGFGGHAPSREELLGALTALETWDDLAVSAEELRDRFAAIEDWSTGAGVRAFYEAYAARQGKPRWGDKTPVHAEHMRPLAAALPEACFVHAVRDPRGVAASLRGLPFAPGDGSLEAIAASWCDTVARARAAGDDIGRYHEVRYEELVASPARVLQELCEVLELEFDPAMLRAHERAFDRLAEMARVDRDAGPAAIPPERRPVYGRILEPVDASRANAWRAELSAGEVARIEAVAGHSMRALGYATITPAAQEATAEVVAAPRLRVVVATSALAHPGGTETYALTVAHELRRLGHEPVLTATDLGAAAEEAERDGLTVARGPEELPADCDAVLAHDAIAATAMAARYPRARIVQVAHSDLYDHQLPPVAEDAVDAVIVLSGRIAERLGAMALGAPVVRLRHPIDTERFADLGPLHERPRRALVVSNYLTGDRRRALFEAWEGAGVECVQAGTETDWTLDVVAAMRGVDIVVGKARAVLEGMSCARAVYVFDEFGGDGWVTPGTYAAAEADNFAGLATDSPRTPGDLRADLEGYHRDMGWINRELVKTHHAARRHAHAVVEVLRGPARAGRPAATALADLSRQLRLAWHAERRTMVLQGEYVRLQRRTLAAEEEAAAAQRRAEAAEAELARARSLLATRRAQAGLRAGGVLDRLRGRA